MKKIEKLNTWKTADIAPPSFQQICKIFNQLSEKTNEIIDFIEEESKSKECCDKMNGRVEADKPDR